jgi:2'-5' RNA ligase
MRLFIGIPLENKAQEAITSYYGMFDNLKTVKKENLHVTIQFLGDTSEGAVDGIKAALDAACGEINPFEISMTRISAFPHTRNARVVFVNVDSGSGAVKKIFRNLEASLAGTEYEKEKRAFIPHVTIGRSKQGMDISGQAAGLKFEIMSKAGKVVLYKSDLEDSGPAYTGLYEVILGNRE